MQIKKQSIAIWLLMLGVSAYAGESIGEPNIEDRLQSTLTAYKENPDKVHYRQMANALKEFEDSSEPVNGTVLKALTSLQYYAFDQKTWKQAQSYGEKRLQVFQNLHTDDSDELAGIHITTGIAYMIPKKKEGLRKAEMHFYAAQKALAGYDYRDIPKNFLRARAWQSLVEVQMRNRDMQPAYGVEAYKELDSHPNLDCAGLEWKYRRPPSFPVQAYSRMSGGAIVVIYDLQPNGKPTNIRVGAEVPQHMFATNSINAVKTWRANLPEDYPASCRTNLITSMTYNIN